MLESIPARGRDRRWGAGRRKHLSSGMNGLPDPGGDLSAGEEQTAGKHVRRGGHLWLGGVPGTSRYPALRRTTQEHRGTGGQPSRGCPLPTSPSRYPHPHPRTHTSTRPDRSERSWLRPQPRPRPERPRPERTSPGRTTRPPIRQGERPEPPRRRGERAAPAMRAFGVRRDSPVPQLPKQGKVGVSGCGGEKPP